MSLNLKLISKVLGGLGVSAISQNMIRLSSMMKTDPGSKEIGGKAGELWGYSIVNSGGLTPIFP